MKVEAIRSKDGGVYSVKDQGEYDLWSTAYMMNTQAAEMRVFNYSIGQQPSGLAGINADRLDTNLNVANNLVDEEMTVYGLAIMVQRFNRVRTGAGVGSVAYTLTTADLIRVEEGSLFSFYSGGEKPFAEGLVTWFPEGGGIYGTSVVANTEILDNGVPTPASARAWRHEIKVRRLEKLWGAFTFPHGALAILPGATSSVGLKVRLLGIRSRGVQ
jgi:hypothetical protein